MDKKVIIIESTHQPFQKTDSYVQACINKFRSFFRTKDSVDFGLKDFDKDSCIIEKLCLDFDKECSFLVKTGLRSQEEYNRFKLRAIFFQLKDHLASDNIL